MWIAKRLCICLLACLLWLAAGTSSRAEMMYQISETELTASKNQNAETRKLLESANQSLKELEDEAKKDIETKTRQRNLWIAISGGLLYALSKK